MSERPLEDIETLVRGLETDVDAGRLRRHIETLAREPRSHRHAPDAMRRAQSYAARELTEAGWEVERRPFRVRWIVGSTDRHGNRAVPLKLRLHREIAGINLIADLPGAGRGRATTVVGAHLDTVEGSAGADDNASGVAVVLETARLLGGLPDRPAVTLALFDMEEVGLIGSRVAARELSRERRVTGMLCLESVGFFDDAPDTQRMPAGFTRAFPGAARAVAEGDARGDFTLVVHRRSSADAADAWRRAAAACTPALPAVPLRDPRPDGLLGLLAGLAVPPVNHLGRSDHAPFWNRRVPALMLTSTANFRNHHYHQPADTPDTIDHTRLAAVTAATAATALHWSRTG